MQRYIDFLDRFKYYIILITTITVALLSLSLKDLAYEGSYKIWFDANSDILKNYEAFRTRFGGDDTFIVAFEDREGIFRPKAIDTILRLTERLKKIDGVQKVDSLTNYPYISGGDDEIVVEDFIYKDDDLTQKRVVALSDELILHQLISDDAKTTMLAVLLSEDSGSDEAVNIAVFKKLEQILQDETKLSGYTFYITGVPAVTASLVMVSQHDAMMLMPLAVIVVSALLFMIFRSYLGVLLPSIVTVYTFLVVLSIEMLLGYKLNNFTVNTPSFITAIAIADVMHLYLAWLYFKQKQEGVKEALVESLRSNIVPMGLTSFTTAVGFATLGISSIEPISTLGIAITSGALLAFMLSITVAPAIILTLKEDYKVTPVRVLNLSNVKGYGSFIRKNDKKIVSLFILLMIVAIYGLFHLRVDSNSIEYFSKDTVVRSGADFVQEHLTGAMRYEIIIDSKVKEGVKEPKFLESVAKFEKLLEQRYDNVRFSSSIKDIIIRMQEVINRQAKSAIPEDKNLIAQYLLLYSMSLPQGMELNEKIDTQERYLRLTINSDIEDTSKDLAMISWIKSYFETNTPYSADVQGQTAIFSYMQKSVTETLINSIALTLLIVTIGMWIFFRDIKLLWLFTLPNIAPIVFVGGIMGYLDISVDIGIAISAAVILGIAVDDTIHFFSKYFDTIKTKGFEQSIDYILSHSGNAMILTTLILSATFSIFGISHFVPNVNFAIVTVIALNMALLFDLLLLPALLSLFHHGKEK